MRAKSRVRSGSSRSEIKGEPLPGNGALGPMVVRYGSFRHLGIWRHKTLCDRLQESRKRARNGKYKHDHNRRNSIQPCNSERV